MAEIRPIPGFPDYFADTDGNVWSQKPIGNNHKKPDKLHLLKPHLNTHGYRIVILWKDRRPYTREIHRLVTEVFLGDRPKGLIDLHGVKGRLDDSLSNLSYGTYKKNCYDDKIRDGTLIRGEEQWKAHLTEEQVREIRRLRGKYSQSKLGLMFGTSGKNINRIHQRTSWAWLE